MTGLRPIDRRSVLNTLAVLVIAVVGSPTTGPPTDERGNGDPSRSALPHEPSVAGVYGGTVDRIVDGEHVVILIEDGDRVIDQRVVPSDAYPDLEEGDPVSLFIVHGRVFSIT